MMPWQTVRCLPRIMRWMQMPGFLLEKVALEMDGYDEAASDFEQAYGEDSSYDRAIQIYETYLDKDMEADGTRYLEAVCPQMQREQRIFAAGEESITIWEIIPMPRKELTDASNQGSTEALLVLGMVYGAQSDYANARAMYQQYINQKLDDTSGESDTDCRTGIQWTGSVRYGRRKL